jgi:molybdenum cofactor guanylyltransferase
MANVSLSSLHSSMGVLCDHAFSGILTGGKARRLGSQDKAMLNHPDGQSFLAKLIESLEQLTPHVLLSCRQEVPYDHLGVQKVFDTQHDKGPLAGLCALLDAAPKPWCFLIACDMPGFRPGVLEHLWRVANLDYWAIVPRCGQTLQPTCALYHQKALKIAATRLASHRLDLTGLIESLPHLVVDFDDHWLDVFLNINTFQELKKFEHPPVD